jgi:cysteine desulfurase
MDRCYFDWAATARPLDDSSPPVPFGNPSSLHREGRAARQALEDARERCARVVGARPEELYFTSGGTESNALVLQSLLLRENLSALISAAEHPSIRENALSLERLGIGLGHIAVEHDGRVSERTIGRALAKMPGVRFAAIMGVNNETGAVTDLDGAAGVLRRKPGAPVHIHSDLVQALGKIPLDLSRLDLDSASFSAHKIGGPRGIGLLWLRKPLQTLGVGGGQEGGVRPGTENTAGACALAACMERLAGPREAGANYGAASARWKRLIQALRNMERCSLIPADRGDEDPAFSPWILQAGFKNIPGDVMVRALDDAGFAVSTGSACSSRERRRPVLLAMGLDAARSLEGIRISQGWSTTMEEIEALIAAIAGVTGTL